ncbi:hypothetical protein ACJJTC_012614 [Scirpophaga incertulas]
MCKSNTNALVESHGLREHYNLPINKRPRTSSRRRTPRTTGERWINDKELWFNGPQYLMKNKDSWPKKCDNTFCLTGESLVTTVPEERMIQELTEEEEVRRRRRASSRTTDSASRRSDPHPPHLERTTRRA